MNIATIHEMYCTGELTPTDLTEHCLARIEQCEPEVKAWVRVDRNGALRLAAEQTQWLVNRTGKEKLPPLFGIPLGVKDIFDCSAWPTQAGSALRADHIAAEDAPAVASVRVAGAILLGKTVTTQFASFDPSVTRNPWKKTQTPGGSSSGSAAAVATGMCVAALASQTGGSIVRPASFCGVVGFKPDYGIISTEGVVPLAPSIDHVGAMAKSVSDVARVFGVLRGKKVSLRNPAENDQELRIGVVRDFFVEQADPEAAAVFEAVLVHLENNVGTLAEADLGVDLATVHRDQRTVMAFECAAYHKHNFLAHGELYGRWISELIEEGLATSAETYAQAVEHSLRFREQALQTLAPFDLLAMPATRGPAPAIDTTGDSRWQSVWSFARLPTISIPCGFAGEHMPLGLQLVGSDDDRLLHFAAECEEVLDLGPELERLLG